MGGLLQFSILAAVFVSVVFGSIWAVQRVQGAVNVSRRLHGRGPDPDRPGGAAPVMKRDIVSNRFLQWVQSSTSISNEKERNDLRRALALAGLEHPSAPVWFVIARFGAAIGLPIAWIGIQGLRDEPVTGLLLIFVALFLCAVGLIAPRAIIDRIGTIRKTNLEHQFPDALDLMVVCVEAGLGLEASFVRVATEVVESHPRISGEFKKVSDELRAGRSRAEALRNLGLRTDVPALKSFSALLIQTDALGTSIAQTLRTYSQEMREHRFLKAEEKAMRIPVLMTVPLVGCILPVVVTALLLPAIIDVIREVLPTLRGEP